jgi:glucosamine-6-phosphate deaminase
MGRPHVEVVDDPSALAHAGADVVERLVGRAPAAALVPATGETPLGLYAELVARRDAGAFDPAALTIVQLDDYLGVDPDDRRSLFGWMDRALLRPLEIPPDHVLRLPIGGDGAACAAFDHALEERGGIDLAILGLGENGHLGFNEPPAPASAGTRAVALTRETIRANARYWGGEDQVPAHAVTLGLRQLLGAREILLLVSGPRKHDIVHRSLEGPVGEDVPASFLRDADAEVTVIVDRAAWQAA